MELDQSSAFFLQDDPGNKAVVISDPDNEDIVVHNGGVLTFKALYGANR